MHYHLLAATTTAPDVSVGHALLQMVIALGVIIGGIYALSKVLARLRNGTPKQRSNNGLSIVSRQPLGKELSIATVRWGEREVLVGIAGSTITFLNDARAEEGPGFPALRSDGKGALEQQLAGAQQFADFSPDLLASLQTRPLAPVVGITDLGHKRSLLNSLRDATLRH